MIFPDLQVWSPGFRCRELLLLLLFLLLVVLQGLRVSLANWTSGPLGLGERAQLWRRHHQRIEGKDNRHPLTRRFEWQTVCWGICTAGRAREKQIRMQCGVHV